MTKRKQVLKIARQVIGHGVRYSEPNTLTRRLKYIVPRNEQANDRSLSYWQRNDAIRGNIDAILVRLRKHFDVNDLREVQIKESTVNHLDAITLLIPIDW